MPDSRSPKPAPAEPEIRGWRHPERFGGRLLAGGVLLLLAAIVVGVIVSLAGVVALGR
jgi:hypothetical protein